MFSSTPEMSSRGRGGYGGYGGRGSGNRGGGYRGSYRGSNRGSYESRGGRGGSYFSSESRYNTAGTRYSNRDRMDESYKKPYRSESYSNREYGGRGSPERKRIRMDNVERSSENYVQGSSDRRSHEGGHYSGSYGRQESYGGSSERRFPEERRRSPARDTYRKSSGMGPPREPMRSSLRPRAARRSFRGRTMRSRSSFRGRSSFSAFSARHFTTRSLAYPRPFKTIKRSSVKSKEDEASSTEEDWDVDDKEESSEEAKTKEPKIKSPKVTEDADEASEGEAADGGEETEKEADVASDQPLRRQRPYVHLACVHCKEKHATFAGYTKHLMSTKHRMAMSGVARRHKAQLLRMRVAQRGAQRSLEEEASAELATRTAFCMVCRLNHRTTRHAHNLTETHRAMKRLLMPFCRVCRLTFRSPMIYEHHICSLDHLKKKARQVARRAASPKVEAASGDEVMDVDLDNFMTLDSVGDVDEVEDDDSGAEKKEDSAPKKPKVEIYIGSEHIKKLEVHWCELCRVYLPRCEAGSAEEAEALRRHCRLRIHLGRYVQHRDTRTLRKHAERIHRQLHNQKDEKKTTSESASKNDDNDDNVKKELNGVDNTAGSEDKLWADVDKDIGEFLREVDPQTNEGSEDEEDVGRYDKFRKSDKKVKTGDAEDGTAEAAIESNNSEIKSEA